MQKKIIPIILAAALLLSSIISLFSILSLQGNARVINYTGVVRGASQKLVKEELYGQPDDVLAERLDQIIDELITGQGGSRLVRLPDEDFQNAMGLLKDSWSDVKQEIMRVRQGGDKEVLFLLSQDLFNQADSAVSAAESFTEKRISQTRAGFIALIILVSGASLLAAAGELRRRGRIAAIEAAAKDNQTKKEQLDKMSRALRAPLNDISELMYISDLDSHDLLFLMIWG